MQNLLFLLYIIFFISVICAFRAISSISTGLLLAIALIKNRIETGSFINKKDINSPFFIGCALFYVLQGIALLYTKDMTEGLGQLQLKSALVLMPLAVATGNYLNATVRNKLMKHYLWILAAAMIYCLIMAAKAHFIQHAPVSVFFYHALVSPFEQHAIQVSILIFIGIVFLLEQGMHRSWYVNKLIHFLLLVFFTGVIFLLSSKLLIVYSVAVMFYYFIAAIRKTRPAKRLVFILVCAGVTVIGLLFFTKNPVSRRYNEIIEGNISLVEQQKFTPAIYFNGLQFRLLEWRFTWEILNENKAWMTGVSPGDAQAYLDKKYIAANMYTGDSTGKGFLGFDSHNQFLQSLLETGLPGLLAFLVICYGIVYMIVQRKNRELFFVAVLQLLYVLNESVFETQYGQVLFIFFPLFLYYGTSSKGARCTDK